MKKKLIVPIFTMVVGIAWLLNSYDVIKGVDWIWSGGLASAGVLCLWIGGFNRLTVVIGPFLISASVLSILRQTDRILLNREIPILVIILGFLMILSHVLRLPNSELLKDGEEVE